MTDEQLSEKISKSATKLVVRKYPFIMSGEYNGIFEPSYSYLVNYDESKNSKRTGLRTILFVDPTIFFEMFGSDSSFHSMIINKRMDFTTKYLSSIYEKTDHSHQDLEKIEDDILKIFYDTGKIMNGTKQLGLLDFFIRYAYLDNKLGDWEGFLDSDVAIPPKGVR
jgi:hypothetical protein